MTPSIPSEKISADIYDQAADWLVEIQSGDLDASGRARLDAWFRSSPQHIRAYLEMTSVWEDAADPQLSAGQSIDALIALGRANENVVTLLAAANASQVTQKSQKNAPPAGVRSFLRQSAVFTSSPMRFAAVLVPIAVISGIGLWQYSVRYSAFATAVGEQRVVDLPDGSTVKLNSSSRIRVTFTAKERDIELLAGEALFHVAKNADRPFVVASGATRVRAVGTEFDVYKQREDTVVTVVEGRVAIITERSFNSPTSPSTPSRSPAGSGPFASSAPPPSALPFPAGDNIYLGAGEQLTVTPRQLQKADHANVAVATAWTQHRLIFDATPLPEVAREFNRYNAKQLTMSDDALKDIRVSGVFSSTDPASLLRFLRAQPEIKVEETDSQIRISRR